MRHSRPGGGGIVVLIAALVSMVVPSGASAHVTKVSGPFQVEMGWGSEPPLAGLSNFVEVTVSDGSGAPVAVPAGALSVEVTFGNAAVTVPLVPDENPGELRGALVPTRPGTYAFHVTGALRGHTLDVGATCSESTFECVGEGSDIEFPAKDPSVGELAQRLGRESSRVEQAKDEADSAKKIALAALALAALAAGASLGLVTRRRRKSGRS